MFVLRLSHDESLITLIDLSQLPHPEFTHSLHAPRYHQPRYISCPDSYILACSVEPRIPPLFWSLPGSQLLYNLLIPAEDEDQLRHRIRGWDLETSFDFNRRYAIYLA